MIFNNIKKLNYKIWKNKIKNGILTSPAARKKQFFEFQRKLYKKYILFS